MRIPRPGAVGLGILVLYLLIRIPLLAVPLDRDEGAFGLIGQAVLAGDQPYRDVFDHKPPGAFYLYALALLIVPPTATGVHLFLLVWNLLTLLVLASLARALAGREAALWTSLLFTIASAAPSVQGLTAGTEMLLLLPLAASLRLLLLASETGGGRRAAWLLLSGACAAGACWIKQSAAPTLLIVPLFLAVRHGRHGWRNALADAGIWLAGGSIPSLLAALLIALSGTWGEFWYWSFTHNLLYAELSWHRWAPRLAAKLAALLPDIGLPLLSALAGGWATRRRPEAWLAAAFLALSFVGACHSGFFYAHYFAQLLPAVALAGGIGLARIRTTILERRGLRAAAVFAVLAAAIALAVPVAARPWYWVLPDPVGVSRRLLKRQGADASAAVAAYVRAHTVAGEWIFVYGSEPQIAFEAERRDANPFVMAYPLTWPWPRHREFQERTWASIERVHPTYLILLASAEKLRRGRGMDPFLETRLESLGQQRYHLEAVVVDDPERGPRIESAAAAGNGTPARPPLFTLWRRNEDS